MGYALPHGFKNVDRRLRRSTCPRHRVAGPRCNAQMLARYRGRNLWTDHDRIHPGDRAGERGGVGNN
jgi:hypothetical protein